MSRDDEIQYDSKDGVIVYLYDSYMRIYVMALDRDCQLWNSWEHGHDELLCHVKQDVCFFICSFFVASSLCWCFYEDGPLVIGGR